MPETAATIEPAENLAQPVAATPLRRWMPALSMTLVSLISYIDRNTLALLAPTMLRELHLNAERYGLVISAFSVAYMAGNPLWGYWLDRFGLRKGMLIAVSAWTVASVSHAFTAGFAGLATARAALGFGEGATFPGGLRTVVQTLPASSQSRGVALAYSGGSLGAVVTPIVITPIALRWGWRGAFWFTGFMGLAWLTWWWVTSRAIGMPASRSRLDPAPLGADQQRVSPRTALRFSDRRVWGFMCAYALGALPLGFILYGAAIYLSQALGKSQLQIGEGLWIPPLGWEVGYFFWGYVVDRKLGVNPPSAKGHRRLMTTLCVLSLPLALTGRIASYPLLLAELFFAMFIAGGFVILAISYATSAYSARHSGLIAGLGAGSWSAMVAVVMPFFGRLFDQQRYDAAFMLAAAFPVTGYLFWLYLSRDSLRPAIAQRRAG